MWRIRRRYAPYLRNILRRVDLAKRPRLALMICRSVVARLGGPRYRRRMQELEASLGLPPSLPPGEGNSRGSNSSESSESTQG
jgi:hypothetical protein